MFGLIVSHEYLNNSNLPLNLYAGLIIIPLPIHLSLATIKPTSELPQALELKPHTKPNNQH